jgi:NAD kinase
MNTPTIAITDPQTPSLRVLKDLSAQNGYTLLQASSQLARLAFYFEKLGLNHLGEQELGELQKLVPNFENLLPHIQAMSSILAKINAEQEKHLLAGRPKRDSFPITKSEIVLQCKSTKLQIDMHRHNETLAETLKRYEKEGIDAKKVLASHEAQVAFMTTLHEIFAPHQFLSRTDMNPENIRKYKLLLMVGGDNHFQYGAQYLPENHPILGVNSDPERSDGYLLGCSSRNFTESLEKLEKGTYLFEPWSRLMININGLKFHASCDVFVGEENRHDMSRHIFSFDGNHHNQRSSGLLICTGAGSTGWSSSAGRIFAPFGDIFPKSSPFARYLLTEPHISVKVDTSGNTSLPLPEHSSGYFKQGEKLIIESVNDAHGIIIADSQCKIPFERGKKAEIVVDEVPNWVVRL